MRYSNQLIIQLEQDATLFKISSDLANKHPELSTHLLVKQIGNGQFQDEHKGGKALAENKLSEQSRFYIVGHGNVGCDFVSGYSGKAFAGLVSNVLTTFKLKAIARIGVVACFGTMWGKAKVDEFGAQNKTNFAQQLHYHLGKSYKIYTQVSAYGACVATDSATGRKKTGFLDNNEVPVYVTKNAQTGKYDNRENKLIYYWKDEDHQAVARQVSQEDVIVDILS